MKNAALTLLRLSIAGFLSTLVLSAAPVTIVVSPPIARADGTLVNGVANIQWQSFTSAQGVSIPAGQIRNAPIINGIFVPALALEPNVAAIPNGTSYRVQYTLNGSPNYSRQWFIPNSSTPVPLQNIEFPIQGLVGTTAIVNPTQLTQGGALLGQPLCWLGAYWGPGNCGGGGGGGANPLVLTRTIIPPDPSDGAGPALRLGYYQSGDFGYLNSNNTGVGPKPLVIQPTGAGGGPVCFFNSSCAGNGTVQISNQDTGGISQEVVVSGPNQISSTSSLMRFKANDANPDRAFVDYLFQFTAPQIIANDTVGGVAGASIQAHLGLLLANNNAASWSSTATYTGTVDTRLVRDSAAVVAIDNGTLGQYGNLKAKSLISTGAAGFTSSVTGQLGYDTTGNFFHGGINGTDEIAVFRATGLPTNGNCAQWSASGVLGVAASPCGAGSGTVDVSTIKSAQAIILASASSTAYAGCPFVSVGALGAQQLYLVNIDVNNSTTTPTLNVCSLGAKAIINFDASALVANQLIAGRSYFIYYDGTNMRLMPFRPVADGGGTISVNAAGAIGVTSGIFATLTGSNTLTGSYDFSGASFTAPFRLSLTAPATCNASAKEFYFNTSTNQLFVCTATNTWTQITGSGGAGGPNYLTLSISSGSLVMGGAVTACSAATPCYATMGNGKRVTFTNNATCGPASGNDNWYPGLDKNGQRTVGYSAVVPTCTNAVAQAGVTSEQTGSGNYTMGSVTVSSGVVSVVPVGQSVQSGPLSITCGTNITCTQAASGITLDATGGGGGTPGGSNKECQYNNAGAFGGITGSDCSGTNFIIPRNGTFGANGRIIYGQELTNQDGQAVLVNHFSDPVLQTAESNSVDGGMLVIGESTSHGVAIWNRGGVQYLTDGTIYTCNSTTRGLTWYTPGGAGVKDLYQICAKDVSDVYAWRSIY